MRKPIAILSYLLLCFIISCKKEEVIVTDINNIWMNCPEKYDLATTAKKLTGEWKYIANGGGRNVGIKSVTENIRVVFTETTIQAYVENNAVNEVKYSIDKSYNEGFYSIKTDPTAKDQFVWGVIEFCNDKVAFKNSFVDGSDYYFQRIK